MHTQLEISRQRFNKHMHRHPGLSFEEVEARLNDALWETITKMEETGGEPDFVVIEEKLMVVDCSKETPKGRRNVCYDEEARVTRKKFPPESSALEQAHEMGVTLLDEKLYFALQEIESFDLKTSSWLLTPPEVRELKGALFGDRRYNRTFIYHNGADSYYGSRAYRAYRFV